MDRVFPDTFWMAKIPIHKPAADEDTSDTARVFSENVNAAMKADETVSSTPKLAKKAKLKTGPISRVRNGKNVTLATLEAVAKGLGVQPWQLLVPGFQPENPPTLAVAGKREQELYSRIRSAAKEIAKIEQDSK